ncbi:hypothetical protein S101413_02951 [Bacillus velezensis]|nr:hypothetical protein S101413_02951 [Bacillus velezensis]
MNASSKTKPGIVDRNLNHIIDSELYSGCYGRVSINFYAFNTAGNKGIACGLNNIQKLEDGITSAAVHGLKTISTPWMISKTMATIS